MMANHSDVSPSPKPTAAWLALLCSTSTLVCCALPALLVALGAGAALAGLVSAFPALVWLSEYKAWVFGLCAVMLLLAGVVQWQNRYAPCPSDPKLANACQKARRISVWVYAFSVLMFMVGGMFAFVLPWLML